MLDGSHEAGFLRAGADRKFDRYTDEYHRMGYSPSEGRGRDEIILSPVCDRRRTTLRIWKTGADLVPVDIGNDDETTFAGRFVNLLEGQAH